MVASQFYISPEDYLAGERLSPIKHEYRRGFVYAMAGAKKPHVVLASNLTRVLGNHLQTSPCIVMSSDIKVRLPAADCYYYPDVVVTCDREDLATTEDFILHPTLVVEILSNSTAAFDLSEKFADYQTCSTLTEYILVSQTEIQVEVFRKNAEGQWASSTYGVSDVVELSSIGCKVAAIELYWKVLSPSEGQVTNEL